MVSVTVSRTPRGLTEAPIEKQPAAMVTSNPQMLRKFACEIVQEAFRQRAAGNNTRFEDLRRGFASKATALDAPSSSQLQHLLVALTQQISQLDGHNISLVKTIVAMNWLGRSTPFVQIYTRFLGSLVSAHAEYSTIVIQMLVQHMTLLHPSVGRIPNHETVASDQIYARVHAALAWMLELVPFAKESLVAVIVSEFPHKSEKSLAQTTYIENMLKITTYVPDVEAGVLGVIIEKMISIDVEIQVDLGDLDSEEGDAIEDGAGSEESETADAEFDEALEQPEMLTYDEDDLIEQTDVPNMTVQVINENIRKLDNVLTILFRHLQRIFVDLPKHDDRSSNSGRFEVAAMTFEALLTALDTTILRTYQSKYTQFILFWSAQMHPSFTDLFLGVILSRTLDDSRPSTHRMIAASYIGSFTARAATLDRTAVRMLTSLLGESVNNFLDEKEGDLSTSRDAVRRFGMFYATIQALFYVFCFRWRELSGLTDDDDDAESSPGPVWMPGLQRTFERAIYNRTLNPLKYCNSNIVTQFAKVAHHLDFVFCGTIIEANRRTSQSGVGEIDSYFPFDPYELKKSKAYVDEVYQTWRSIPGLSDDDDDSDSDDDSEMEE